jgi:hypothetical protein
MRPLTVYNILLENKCRTTARQRVLIGRQISQRFDEQTKVIQKEDGTIFKVNSYKEEDRDMITSMTLSLYRILTKKRTRTNDNHFQKLHRDKKSTLHNGHGGC